MTLMYRWKPWLHFGVEYNPKVGEVHPLITLIPVRETKNRPAIVIGYSSDRIGTPEGDSFYITASKDLEFWTGLPVAPYFGVVYGTYEHRARPIAGLNMRLRKDLTSLIQFDGVKVQAETEAKAKADGASGNTLADSFFGAGNVVGNDMTFAWVNKDNILSVYQKFYETFDANKDNYTRQDLDKVKAWYEALDNRKNTVEKEGLSSDDNGKIASLKLKFAPKFRWERMTAKGEENADAKE